MNDQKAILLTVVVLFYFKENASGQDQHKIHNRFIE